MSPTLKRLCPGCKVALIASPARRCDSCARTARRERADVSGDRFYSSQPWRRTRARKLALTPWCEVGGCRLPAAQVDHKLDRRTRPHLAFDLDNLVSMCASHHSSKTARTRSGWSR